MVNPALEKQIGIYSVHTRTMKIDQVRESSRLRVSPRHSGGVPSGAEAFIPTVIDGQFPEYPKYPFFIDNPQSTGKKIGNYLALIILCYMRVICLRYASDGHIDQLRFL